MSTTPTIFSRPRVPYTALGGGRVDRIRKEQGTVSLLVLNRGGRFNRERSLAELAEADVGDVLWVEGPKVSYEIEALSRAYPEVRFLLLQGQASPGECVNLGMEETRSRFLLVIWSDMRLGREAHRALAEQPAQPVNREQPAQREQRAAICLVPQLRGPAGEVLPTIQVPALVRGRLKMLPFSPVRPGMRSVFPYDYCGLYDRGRFLAVGGFDAWMRNPYWQKLDFGLRCALWGERIHWGEALELRYLEEPTPEDSSADASYKLFYLKNEAVRFDGEAGLLPRSRWPTYALRCGSGLVESRREFREVEAWVRAHRYRFKSDLAGLVNRWELPA
jgi:hypothetical protein